jgi:hypothetical protein
MTNLTLDPQSIYWRGRPLWLSATTNDRYLSLGEYISASESYSGLLFGSSRAGGIPLDALADHVGGTKFANFAVYGGMITDHLRVLEFVLRDKEAKGSRLQSVFLLLDADMLGARPLTNRILQYTWPPALTGENTLRFWSRNLIAIQFAAWQDIITHYLKSTSNRPADDGDGNAQMLKVTHAHAAVFRTLAAPENPDLSTLPRALERERIRERKYFAEHLALLRTFVARCREKGVTLTIVLSPLRVENAANFNAVDLAQVVAEVSHIAPVWDFGSPQWLSDRADLWFDLSHFTPMLGRMMLDRIFYLTAPGMGEDFGILRGN